MNLRNISPHQIAYTSNATEALWSVDASNGEIEVVLNKKTGQLCGGWLQFSEDAADWVSDDSMDHAQVCKALKQGGVRVLFLDNMSYAI